jgi:imidazoleglycerol phosphate dehydratase HisB
MNQPSSRAASVNRDTQETQIAITLDRAVF